jgi:hypothetical protein
VDVISFHHLNDHFEVASHPLHQDKPGKHGVGLALDFATEAKRLLPDLAEYGIALVPCAWGGRFSTPFFFWHFALPTKYLVATQSPFAMGGRSRSG